MEATIVATWKFVDIHKKTCKMNTIIIVQCTCTIKGKMKRCKDCLSTKLEHSKIPHIRYAIHVHELSFTNYNQRNGHQGTN